jgi:hypothetical protein
MYLLQYIVSNTFELFDLYHWWDITRQCSIWTKVIFDIFESLHILRVICNGQLRSLNPKSCWSLQTWGNDKLYSLLSMEQAGKFDSKKKTHEVDKRNTKEGASACQISRTSHPPLVTDALMLAYPQNCLNQQLTYDENSTSRPFERNRCVMPCGRGLIIR